MSLVSRLSDRLAEALGARPDDVPPATLATAAILIHVARADGVVQDGERAALLALLSDRFRLPAEAARHLLDRADAVDRETDDIADLIEMLGHGATAAEREALVEGALRVARADGTVAEFEDDLIWRLAAMLGVDDRTLDCLRDAAG